MNVADQGLYLFRLAPDPDSTFEECFPRLRVGLQGGPRSRCREESGLERQNVETHLLVQELDEPRLGFEIRSASVIPLAEQHYPHMT
jgi:hypothetical protein